MSYRPVLERLVMAVSWSDRGRPQCARTSGSGLLRFEYPTTPFRDIRKARMGRGKAVGFHDWPAALLFVEPCPFPAKLLSKDEAH